ncbi:predicted protein [Chaetoceros tenuissimus]|uniref:EKC/KEOPS complex subunit CGI121 n=1 Tax=Chaetoceros tenuissimus TaxID=426638 RepID=A0AAD3CKY7_9STRA|nr:predicted protein [Chaetoceros tenuissimus]
MAQSQIDASIIKLKCGLFPDTKIFVSLFKDVSINPYQVNKTLSSVPTNENYDHYAILNANRITSVEHVAVAVNSSLMRFSAFSKDSDIQQSNFRGRALDSVVCCAGTTHTGSAMKDYALSDETSDNTGVYDIILIGIDVTLEQFTNTLSSVDGFNSCLDTLVPRSDVADILGRERSAEEVTKIIKLYKTTKEEVAMQGLAKAVINRVSSKYYV